MIMYFLSFEFWDNKGTFHKYSWSILPIDLTIDDLKNICLRLASEQLGYTVDSDINIKIIALNRV